MQHPTLQNPPNLRNSANTVIYADRLTCVCSEDGHTLTRDHDARAGAVELAALRKYSDIPGPEEVLAPALSKLHDAVEKLSSSLDTGLQNVSSKFEKLEEKMDASFEQLEQRVKKIEQKVEKIEQKVEKIEQKLNLAHQEAVRGRNGSRMEGTLLQYEIVPFNDGSDPVETLRLPPIRKAKDISLLSHQQFNTYLQGYGSPGIQHVDPDARCKLAELLGLSAAALQSQFKHNTNLR